MIIAARRKPGSCDLVLGPPWGCAASFIAAWSRFARTGHDCSAEHHKRQCRCDGVV
jgi:hypothetical protein